MPAISETYASPGLRHGLLLEDHPQVEVKFTCQPGIEVGIPPRMGGNEDYAVATIIFPPASGKPPAVGFKAVASGAKRSGDHDSDVWLVLCTKALGRALKRAGYPSDTKDLKSLLLWRQRGVEIQSIGAGMNKVAIAPAQIEKAIDEAARSSEDALDLDDGDAPVKSDAIEDAVIVDRDDHGDGDVGERLDMVAPDPDTLKDLRSALGALGPRQKDVTEWCRANGMKVTKPQSQAEALEILAHARSLAEPTDEDRVDEAVRANAEAPDGVDPSTGEVSASTGDPATLAELIASLAEEELPVWSQFLASLNLEPGFDPSTVSAGQADEILTWFAVTGD